MSCCNDCFDLCELIKGQTAETIGAISSLNTAVFVWFEHLGTGRREVEDVTTDGSGNVVVPLTAVWLDHGQPYRIVVTLAEYSSTEQDITPPGETQTYDCLTFTLIDRCE